MKSNLTSIITSLGIILAASAVLIRAQNFTNTAFAAPANNVVISEIQIGGTSATDEFVELYNPTTSSVDLTGWRLRRTGGADQNLVASMSGTIPAGGFFLVTNPGYDGLITADQVYSASSSAITANSTVSLFSDAGLTLVDRVGMGTAVEVEASAAAVPANDGSIERKACTDSTTETMITNLSGNAEDTDNNFADFVLRVIAGPQNSQSSNEISSCAQSTASPTATAIATSSATPSPVASPTTTASPTTSPVGTATPSSTPTITAVPTATATPTSKPNPLVFACRVEFTKVSFGFFTLRLPFLRCY